MLVVTSEKIEGKKIVETLGLVKGNTVRAKWIGKDILAALRNLVGGELREYTEMLSEAREESINRMVKDAEKLGADAVISARFMTSQTMSGAAELLAYGTAVKLG
ncbi:MAG: YbjQ family protein [Methanocellales archaeon]|nr:YbjQ family protein [Methanocellales archaeon]MDD3292196.1 YbjQ family protein [Methanocellales archaeon]MDD5235737.1 YbjQ family protein [Methanocellales archaeon]MDD5485802.1 YbjQ family protein [Methanocellales archaeon]